MGIQSPTARDVELARMREAFLAKHRLKDYKLSGRHLMKMVLSSAPDEAASDAIRTRFTSNYGCSLRWHGPTWDHMEMMGRGRQLIVMVSHPYSPPNAACPDLELFRRAGLNVVLGGQEDSWYGYGTYHVRVEHPAFSGEVSGPAPRSAEAARESGLHRAAPGLLQVAKTFAAQLADAMGMVPCTGAGGVTPCVHCLMRDDFDRITALVVEAEGIDPTEKTR